MGSAPMAAITTGAAGGQVVFSREAIGVDISNPYEDRDDVANLVFREVVLDHLALAGEHRLRVTQEDAHPLFATALNHLGQFRGILGTFAKQGVAAHAVVGLPELVAMNHLFGDGVAVGTFGYSP
ncbi:MAG: hypothetical protein ACJATT_000939 [Myxococcota bacterium]|jgi:hypothetical protein